MFLSCVAEGALEMEQKAGLWSGRRENWGGV